MITTLRAIHNLWWSYWVGIFLKICRAPCLCFNQEQISNESIFKKLDMTEKKKYHLRFFQLSSCLLQLVSTWSIKSISKWKILSLTSVKFNIYQHARYHVDYIYIYSLLQLYWTLLVLTYCLYWNDFMVFWTHNALILYPVVMNFGCIENFSLLPGVQYIWSRLYSHIFNFWKIYHTCRNHQTIAN